jgi:hypothetical protein
MQEASTKLDEFARAASPSPSGMDAVWNDAAIARIGVRDAMKSAIRTLEKVESSKLAKPDFGPASSPVEAAQTALSELRIARAHLEETLDVYQAPFGGVHAILRERPVSDVGLHLSRAMRATERAVRTHVNGA